MKTYLNKGFTLIELLVVIAIIGILTSVVLASLSSARDKGSDAAIKADLASVKSQAGIYFTEHNNFTDICTDPDVARQIQGAYNSTGATTTLNTDINQPGDYGVVTCHGATNSWAVEVPLKTDRSKFWCVNDQGLSVTTDGPSLDADETDCTTP